MGANILGQPSDVNLLNAFQQWSQVGGVGRPADYATRNTGVLANLNSVPDGRIDVGAVAEENAAEGADYQVSFAASGSAYNLLGPLSVVSDGRPVKVWGRYGLKTTGGQHKITLALVHSGNLNPAQPLSYTVLERREDVQLYGSSTNRFNMPVAEPTYTGVRNFYLLAFSAGSAFTLDVRDLILFYERIKV